MAVLMAMLATACGPRPKPSHDPESTPEAEAPAEAASTPAPAPAKAKPAAPNSATPRPTAKPTPHARVSVSTQPPPANLWKEFSGDRAWRTVKQLVEVGPRPSGSMENGRTRAMLTAALRSLAWEVEEQPFTAKTPRGEIAGVNLIARFSADGTRPVPRTPRGIMLGAHYDTRYFSTIRFVGANDGASGPAVLVEAARVLSLDPQLAAQVSIVFFDASEPRGQFTPDDGLAGSKFFAKSETPRRGVILHAVGDAGGPLTLPPGTAIELLADLRDARPALTAAPQFESAIVKLWGDHLPFGPGTLLLGNHDYLARYTQDDTLEQVNPATLASVGELTVWLAKRWASQAK